MHFIVLFLLIFLKDLTDFNLDSETVTTMRCFATPLEFQFYGLKSWRAFEINMGLPKLIFIIIALIYIIIAILFFGIMNYYGHKVYWKS